MKPTVTMLLSEFEQVRMDAEERMNRLQKINQALKTVHNTEIEDVLRIADEIETSRARASAREAIATGRW